MLSLGVCVMLILQTAILSICLVFVCPSVGLSTIATGADSCYIRYLFTRFMLLYYFVLKYIVPDTYFL
ncbi:hypothetical protein BDF19DRAFT_437258 [Syncephalis fuscata]|nr:hypothetical protein BDF19DRAFT_437258 [Syncephalis fuscata]